uniref:Uncharacterized protein n=1 Tax=Avena sativa TaxID=4498 RepID=A0ACD5ZGK1_AVESA
MELGWLLLGVVLIFSMAFFLFPRGSNHGGGLLPPGPTPLPFLGNLIWLTSMDDIYKLRAQGRLHERFGPLLTLRMGSRLEVTVSDSRVAHAALVGCGAAVADRPEYGIRNFAGLDAVTITSSNYGPFWRLFRRNFAAEVAHPARLRLFAPLRASVVADLSDRLRRQQGTIKEAFRYATFSLLTAMCFGEVLPEGSVREIQDAVRDLSIFGMNKLDVFFILPALTDLLFRGRRRTAEAMRGRLKGIYVPLIEARRRVREKHISIHKVVKETTTTLPHSYLDTLLDARLDFDGGRALSEAEIIGLCSELLIQGTDTTVTALEWIMAELVKNQSVQERLYEEINIARGHKRGGGGQLDEEDLQKMPYLRAVVLEGLRRHPPGQQLVPHAAAEDVQLGGYLIPKGTTMNFRVRDMGMDEKTWERPTEFVPERFLEGGEGEGMDITGTREIRMMPFGAGRRICPGIGVAMLHMEYIVANLVHTFQWKPAEGDEVDVLAEMSEFTVIMKKTLRARLLPRP